VPGARADADAADLRAAAASRDAGAAPAAGAAAGSSAAGAAAAAAAAGVAAGAPGRRRGKAKAKAKAKAPSAPAAAVRRKAPAALARLGAPDVEEAAVARLRAEREARTIAAARVRPPGTSSPRQGCCGAVYAERTRGSCFNGGLLAACTRAPAFTRSCARPSLVSAALRQHARWSVTSGLLSPSFVHASMSRAGVACPTLAHLTRCSLWAAGHASSHLYFA
jgi:hypothetical protein